jgi:hypothetical protein
VGRGDKHVGYLRRVSQQRKGLVRYPEVARKYLRDKISMWDTQGGYPRKKKVMWDTLRWSESISEMK